MDEKKKHLQTALTVKQEWSASLCWDILTPAGLGWYYIMYVLMLVSAVCEYVLVYWPLAADQQWCGSLQSAGVWKRNCLGQEWVFHSGDFSGVYSWHRQPQGCSATPLLTPLPISSVNRRENKNEGKGVILINLKCQHCWIFSLITGECRLNIVTIV